MESYAFPVQGRYNKLELAQKRDAMMVGVLEDTVCEKSRRKLVILSLEGRKD